MLFVDVGTCLSVKLAICIQTVRCLQWVSFTLFNTDNILTSCSENRLSLLCNLLWWVGVGISSALPSACIRPPLQWFSNERHLLCNACHLYFDKCTWEYILVFKIICIFISSVFWGNSLRVMWAQWMPNISRSGAALILLDVFISLASCSSCCQKLSFHIKRILAILYTIKMVPCC